VFKFFLKVNIPQVNFYANYLFLLGKETLSGLLDLPADVVLEHGKLLMKFEEAKSRK